MTAIHRHVLFTEDVLEIVIERIWARSGSAARRRN
jgi:hypothetical protein